MPKRDFIKLIYLSGVFDIVRGRIKLKLKDRK